MKIKNFKLITILSLYTLSLLLITPVHADTPHTMDVSAFVQPQASDYQFNFISSDGQTTVTNGSIMTYQITYGVKPSANLAATNTTIVVNWSNDLSPKNEEILEYINGTASDGYEGAKPIIDIINHTITWTIPNLPSGTTDQKVTFQMRTINAYFPSIDSPISFTLTADMSNQFVTMPQLGLTQYYRYHIPPPGPTGPPTPIPTTPITPTPAPPPPPLYTVSIPGISQDNGTFSITTEYPSKISISYGTSPANLSHTISSNDNTYDHTITLSDLLPDTTYYVSFVITSMWGYSTHSEIYTFHTAKASAAPSVDNNIIVFSANGTVYFSETQKQNNNSKPSVILTDNNPYQLSYALTSPMQIKSIEAIVLSKILASNTQSLIQLPSSIVIPMDQVKPTLFVANLNTLTTGLYEIYVRITDMNGNIIQKKISDLKVMPRFTVYAKDTNAPLQDARVMLYYYDSLTHHYLPLQQDVLGDMPNPGYTDANGQLAITLPAGNYRVEESALLYNTVTTDFTIGPGINQNYPIVYLSRDPLNVALITKFATNYIIDTWHKLVFTVEGYASSIRLFHLFAVAILASFVLVNFLLFTLRAQIKAHHLPIFFLFHVDKMFNRHAQKYIYGTITDEEKRPISQVLIEFEDRDTKKILLEIMTNKAGRFYCRNNFAGEINLLLSKIGYAVTTVPINTLTFSEDGLKLQMTKGTQHYHSGPAHLVAGIAESAGVLFETSLVVTLILELLFISIYGLLKTSPYLLLSILNILLWLFFIHEHEQGKEL